MMKTYLAVSGTLFAILAVAMTKSMLNDWSDNSNPLTLYWPVMCAVFVTTALSVWAWTLFARSWRKSAHI
ncbi:MAG: hypothetical protein ABSD74_17435 [Rhizomicrobium sp.]|jgi:protein-S-isoprenylcysteine O-methyltransferase Ste14